MPKSKSSSGLLVAGLGFGVAIGVALGALAIAPNMNASAPQDDSGEKQVQGEQEVAIAEAQADSGDSILADLASESVAGILENRPVMVIAAPDAKAQDVDAVRGLLDDAAAIDAGRINLTEDFFNQDKADELKSLVANTLPAGAELSESAMDAGTHTGEALSAAVMLNPEDAEPLASVEDRATLLQALRESGFIDYEDGTILPAQAVVVITGTGGDAYSRDNLDTFTTAFQSTGGNTVLAGRIEAAGDEGAIGKLRAQQTADTDDAVSTVDSLNRAWARMAVVLAVHEQLEGGSGAYGAAADVDAASPALPEN